MNSTRQTLLSMLAKGSMKYTDACKNLAASGGLGFGVEPSDVVSAAIEAGVVSVFDSGGKYGQPWLKLAAPFVPLYLRPTQSERRLCLTYLNVEYISSKDELTPREGDLIEVKWPDGSITRESVDLQTEVNQGPYLASIRTNVRGLAVRIPLGNSEIKVRADAFA